MKRCKKDILQLQYDFGSKLFQIVFSWLTELEKKSVI